MHEEVGVMGVSWMLNCNFEATSSIYGTTKKIFFEDMLIYIFFSKKQIDFFLISLCFKSSEKYTTW